MTAARSRIVDLSVTRWYHCISKCVRGAFLLSDKEAKFPPRDRKAWLEQRIEELTGIFAISVAGYAILDNHLHALLRVDENKHWSAEEVVRRWFQLYPPRGKGRKLVPITDELVAKQARDEKWVATRRKRLQTLGWFHKLLKEPLSRMVNKAEDCSGSVFEGRYKSIAVIGEEALLSVNVYIDLNPLAAGLAATPEECPYTSLKQRVEHAKCAGRTDDLSVAMLGSVAASQAAEGLEEANWLIPIEDRRRLDSSREGMQEGFTLGNYLLLVDFTGRLFREGKATIAPELAAVFDRLGSSAEFWETRLMKLRKGRLLGRFLATSRECLRAAAARLGVHHLANLDGCPAA
ncbi:MAG: hypothetical protein KDA45_04070 [Planctomycetales bacterium]|nr:hypothetical protein [Planctomycetales bacterium]